MSLERRVALVTAFEAGFRAALESADLYDRERGRLGRALTDDEIRRLAEFWVYPIRVVSGTQSFSREGTGWSPPSILFDRRGRWQAGVWQNLPAKDGGTTPQNARKRGQRRTYE